MISEIELHNIKGGSSGVVLGVVGLIIVFLIGVVDGYLNPESCNNEE